MLHRVFAGTFVQKGVLISGGRYASGIRKTYPTPENSGPKKNLPPLFPGSGCLFLGVGKPVSELDPEVCFMQSQAEYDAGAFSQDALAWVPSSRSELHLVKQK